MGNQTSLGIDTPLFLSDRSEVIPLFKVHMPKSILQPLSKTLFSGYIGEGVRVQEFEKALVPWFGNSHILTVNSCTSAIQLALRLSHLGYGDEVISTPMTCVATNVPIRAVGARIVWADIDPMTGNIDPSDVRRKITSKTKAVIIVHWGGYPCELDELNQIGQKYGVKIIEDAAHAFGATYHERPIGSYSDFVCFSFQAIKHLTTVDGGALVCRDLNHYEQGKLLRWYGMDRETENLDLRCEQDVKEWGYKFHMNDAAAAIGLEQLKYIDKILKRHRENALYYRKRFKDISGLKLLDYQPDRESSYWLFTFRVRNRLRFMEKAKGAKIMVSQVHARNDKYTMFRDFQSRLPGVDEFVREQVSIPVGWWLNARERRYIADNLLRILE